MLEYREAPVVLSVRQPWAWAIAYGGKNVENRAWPTAYRGPILIHASTKVERHDVRDAVDRVRLKNALPVEKVMRHYQRRGATVGAVVAWARLWRCFRLDDGTEESWRESWQCGGWATGPWCFEFANVTPVVPVAMKGRLGIFPVPPPLMGNPLMVQVAPRDWRLR